MSVGHGAELSCAQPGQPSTAFYELNKFIQSSCEAAAGALCLPPSVLDPIRVTLMKPTRSRLHRSELAVPGSNVRMLEKAPKLGADIVMLDLEDAVAPDDKPQARRNIIERAPTSWTGRECSVSLRINGLDTHYCYRDIVDVVEQAGQHLDSIMIPKACGCGRRASGGDAAHTDRGGDGPSSARSR